MVKHIVFFKHQNFEELKESLQGKLLALKKDIDYIVDLEVGIDFLNSERSFNAVLIVVLQNRDDLKRYASDPRHTPVLDWVRSNGFETKVVDFDF